MHLCGNENRREGGLLYQTLAMRRQIPSRGGPGKELYFKMAFEFLSCVQGALLPAGYDNIILKVKQVNYLESLYLKKDLVAVLPTGYGKSLVFHVFPRLLKERDARVSSSQSVGSSVVVVISPLNALTYDHILKLRERGVKAAVLGVKVRLDEEGDSVLDSKWEGTRGTITKILPSRVISLL